MSPTCGVDALHELSNRPADLILLDLGLPDLDGTEVCVRIRALSQAPITDRALGTRHRAALGLAEQTDAIVVVVSEETSSIVVASSGRIVRNMSRAQIKDCIIRPLPATLPSAVGMSA